MSHSKAKPFLKWAGGKRELLPSLLAKVPPDFRGAYHEPFVGGGALFFALAPERAFLSDVNERLIRAYLGLRDSVDSVIDLLNEFPQGPGAKDFYLALRGMPIDESKNDFEVSAWFIYLNRMGFNGLYRVNKKNEFNVPFGDKDSFKIDEEGLLACSAALQGAQIKARSFEKVLYFARPGDLVYFDPPYIDAFTGYTDEGFDMGAQESLRDVALILKRLHTHVIISNSDNETVRRLYKGFTIDPVACTRRINCNAEGRGQVGEVIIT